jgi:hypothetical protein
MIAPNTMIGGSMPTLSGIYRALAAATVLTAAGCGGAQLAPAQDSSAALQQVRAKAHADATGWAASVFVADAFAGKVYQFADAANGSLLGTIADSSQPNGLDMDANGNLYVAAEGNAAIKIYAAGTYSASASLSDPGEFVIGVAVCPNGFVYAVNQFNTSNGPGNIKYYAPGKTSPSGIVPDTNVYEGVAAACDSKNVLWFLYQTKAGATNLASFDGKKVHEYGDRGLGGADSGVGVRALLAGGLAIGNLSTGVNLVGDPPKKKGTGKSVGCRAGSPSTYAFGQTDGDIYELNSADSYAEKCDAGGGTVYTIGDGTLQFPSGIYVYPPANT